MEKVLFEKKGAIAYVTINRPERLNACDFETYAQLASIWEEVRDDPALRVGILTGVGERAFCAGSDIKANYVDRPEGEPPNRLFPVLLELKKPIIAAIMVTPMAAAWNKPWPAIFGSRLNMGNLVWVKYALAGFLAAAGPRGCPA
jgi:enoyl-CoA hydratase/carnithine racemase